MAPFEMLMNQAAPAAQTAPPAVTGIRLALERGGGSTAVPVRSTVLSMTLGIGTSDAMEHADPVEIPGLVFEH